MKYKVGDKVKIKTWEQMEAEFGLDRNGHIPCDCTFVHNMRGFCGTIQEIDRICEDYYNVVGLCWSFSDDMFEGLVPDSIPASDSEDPVPAPDMVNHPFHYCQEGSMECIDEMVAVFGEEAVMHFCLLNVWKYRKRAVFKNGEEDLKKSDWYMKKYLELKGDV
jgi:hypothetical protein